MSAKDPALIELKPTEAAMAVEDAIRADCVPLLLSSPGMGKSQIIQQTCAGSSMLDWFKSTFSTKTRPVKRIRLIDERVSTMDLTDWRGIPDIDRIKKRTVWYPPDFLPSIEDDPTIVFLDEITAVPPQCQSPLLQVLLDGKLGTVWQRPDSTRFVAAGNLMTDGAFVNQLGSALRDRVVFIYLKPDLDDWCRWAYAKGIAPVVIAFLRFRPALLYAFDAKASVSPTSRGWEFVSDIVVNARSKGRSRDALLQGKVGCPATMEFTTFEMMFDKAPSIDSIKMNPETAAVPNEPALMYAVANALSVHTTVQNISQIMKYLVRIPSEYAVFAAKMMTRRDPKLGHTPSYGQWMLDNSDAMA